MWWSRRRFERLPEAAELSTFQRVGKLIKAERARQDAKFGPHGNLYTMPAFQRLSVLTEEVGELAQALNDVNTKLMFSSEHHAALKHAKEELVQVAAVAVAWLEVLEQHGYGA